MQTLVGIVALLMAIPALGQAVAAWPVQGGVHRAVLRLRIPEPVHEPLL